MKEYPNYLEFSEDYSKTPNIQGIRLANRKELYYLLKEFKDLKISENLRNYSYVFVTEIIAQYDVYANGSSVEIIIDDPQEILDFQKDGVGLGYDSNGEQHDINRGSSYMWDWSEQTSVFFLVRSI